MTAPLHVPELPDGCACIWTSPSWQPGWILRERHPGCRAAVHGEAP